MKRALVTGASSGIGEAVARKLDSLGYELIVVARREERLRKLAGELSNARWVAVDLTAEDAPAKVRGAVGERLDLLVNNAGSAWRAAFGDRENGGYANVRRTMELNFDAVVRLTEELLPVLRESAPSAIVNVSSIAGRVASPKSGAYNASKFALTGWSEALHFEERANGVHVGTVFPGFVATEGFPQAELVRNRSTCWTVSAPEKVAEAVVRAAEGKAEVSVPRPWGVVPRLRSVAPALYRRIGGKRK